MHKCYRLIVSVVLGALLGPIELAAQEKAPAGDSFHALPGVVRVNVAGPVPKGITLSGFAGYGYSNAILSTDDSHHRGIGGIAASFRFVDWLAFAINVDGRYDKHFRVSEGTGRDDGWVGNPRLLLRSGVQFDNGFRLGGQLGVWFPGESAPSLVLKATTFDVLATGTYAPPGSGWTVNLNAGARIDQSAKSVDNAAQLSDADRMSLGVSDSHAVLLGAGITYRVGALEFLVEGTWDLLVGGDAPSATESPIRVAGGARYDITRDFTALLVAEGGLSKRPPVSANDPLVPIEPRVTVLAGIQYRLPYARRKKPIEKIEKVKPPPPPPKPVVLKIHVATAEGFPLAGAKIRIEDTQVVTGAEGGYEHTLPKARTVTIVASADGYVEKSQQVDSKPGETKEINFRLDKVIPPGQLKGVVQSFGGTPLQATIRIDSIGVEVKAESDGTFEVDVPPGEYQVTVQADGYVDQTRTVRIEREGVTLLNVDLRSR